MGLKSRNITAVVLVLFSLSIIPAIAQMDATTWGTYHGDAARLGVNTLAPAQDGSAINLIWTFPRLDVSPYNEDDTIVDMTTIPPGPWENPAVFPAVPWAGNYYGISPGFYLAKARPDDPTTPETAWATWDVPLALQGQWLRVQVWFPSSPARDPKQDPKLDPTPINSPATRFTIHDADGKDTTFVIDQSQGGEWVDLGDIPFKLDGTSYVRISNQMEMSGTDYDNSLYKDKYIVVADAVRFIPSTGTEMYSSPAAGIADIGGTPIPVAWIGAIESSAASLAPGIKDFGAMYCVRSQTGIGYTPGDADSMTVGTAAWRYPRGGAYDNRQVMDRLPIEGPIGRIGSVGGIFSSPTLVSIIGMPAIVFGGMDGQVYCLEAATGRLLWKGPGVTVPEPLGSLPAEWQIESTRYDCFGGQFARAPVVQDPDPTDGDPGGTSITYDISGTDSDPGDDAAETSDGHLYAIYAWMPGMAAGDLPRATDAVYRITYYDAATMNPAKTTIIKIDQSDEIDDPNVGRWVRIGTSYWNPRKVELFTGSMIPDPVVTRYVVADAIMVVPEDIGPFSYSTAATDGQNIYIGNTNGRVYSFALNQAGRLRWTFPQVQTKNPVTDLPTEGAASPFGSIVASPSFSPGHVIVPSTDGKVYDIKSDGSDLNWTYTASEGTPTIDDIPSFESESLSSSATIYGNRVYVPSSGGRMHAIKIEDGTRVWIYPDRSDTVSQLPLSGFKFSTPAVYDRAGSTKIACGSVGGKVYMMQDGATVGPDAVFAQPSFYSPIQSSVAIDGPPSPSPVLGNIYVGTMGSGDGEDGDFWWMDRDTGLTYGGWGYLGTIFSSPAVANGYVYVGTGIGRLCAFSSTAFGGEWVGGGGPEGPDPPGAKRKAPDPANTTQVDIFTSSVYEETVKAFMQLAETDQLTVTGPDIKTLLSTYAGTLVPPDSAADLFVNSDFDGTKASAVDDGHKRAYPYPGTAILSSDGKRQVYLEWGEDLCLIAWGINKLEGIAGTNTPEQAAKGIGSAAQKNHVRFRFVNSSEGPGAGATMKSKNADYLFQYKDKDGEFYCVAMAKIELKADKRNPPSPGSGWNVSVDVRLLDENNKKVAIAPGIVPLLTGMPGSWTVDDKVTWPQQPVGINNPLAIATGNNPQDKLAWPNYDSGTGGFTPNSQDPEAHYNGNSVTNEDKTAQVAYYVKIPRLNLGPAPHGANSPIGKLGVMDRSAVGLRVSVPGTTIRGEMIDGFRIETNDLHWLGDTDAVQSSGGIIFPWDYKPYEPFGLFNSRIQRDYPDISKRGQYFQKSPDNSDPSIEKTTLQPALPLDSTIEAIDYQNCRLRADIVDNWVQVPKFQPANMTGYSTTAIAYIDANQNGRFDGGDDPGDRPTTYNEPYRKFELTVKVPPDYHMVVERPETIDITGPDRAQAPHGLGVGVVDSDMIDWWKDFTVRNLGNVNLPNIKVANELSKDAVSWSLKLFAENVNPFFPLAGSSSLDLGGQTVQAGIVSSLDGWDPKWLDVSADPFLTPGLGYTLSKPRVGDVTGLELTIPDARKCLERPDLTLNAIIAKEGDPTAKNQGILPSVSVRVPLTQPSGSYHELVPVFADFDNDDVLDLGKEPFSDPTFKLNVMIAEDRLTGGPTPGSAPQIDPSSAPLVTSGNTQPTAWRDPATGKVHLFWSSNRLPNSSATPDAPWFLRQATLHYESGPLDEYNWRLLPSAGFDQWWEYAAGQLPGFDWPAPPPGFIASSVRHSSPWAAVNEDADNVWLFWQGTADARDAATEKIERGNLIFYTPATGGQVSGDSNSVFSLARDIHMPKMNPRAIAYNSGTNENIWLTWHGGDSGRWNIFGNLNISPANNHNKDNWSPDVQFLTPTCLVSVSEPSPVHRKIGSSDAFLDLAYTGMSKYDQAADVILTRYLWAMDPAKGLTSLTVDPVQLPRVYNEELLRDAKKNVYTSEHLAWLRPPSGGTMDFWGSRANPVSPDSPYIHVILPDGTLISGTDGRVEDSAGAIVEAGRIIAPQLDRATGVYTYTHTGVAATLIGQMLVDFSAGIIRFSNPLPPKTKVYADYTPQAKRLTRGLEQDSAPFMFIEKTPMVFEPTGTCPNPGLIIPSNYTKETPTDRLWLFWRKPTSGVQASTVYYKTYRIARNLKNPVELGKDGRPTKPVTLINALGPCEISWDGKKVFFTAVDERYPGMPGYQGAAQVRYTPNGASRPITVSFDTLTWDEELSETALPTRQSVNEGQISAFADPNVVPSKVWVFWSSTRAGQSDLYYQTISPNFRAIY